MGEIGDRTGHDAELAGGDERGRAGHAASELALSELCHSGCLVDGHSPRIRADDLDRGAGHRIPVVVLDVARDDASAEERHSDLVFEDAHGDSARLHEAGRAGRSRGALVGDGAEGDDALVVCLAVEGKRGEALFDEEDAGAGDHGRFRALAVRDLDQDVTTRREGQCDLLLFASLEADGRLGGADGVAEAGLEIEGALGETRYPDGA